TDTDNSATISGKTVTFGGTAAVSGQSASTNGAGLSSVTLTAISTPTTSRTVTADFAGDTSYNAATQTSASTDVVKRTAALSTPSLSVGSIKWGKDFTAST